MENEKSEEHVIVKGSKYFVHDKILDLNTIPASLSEIEGIDRLKNLELKISR